LADERHDNIYPVRRVNLRKDLAAHARLARRIGEQCRIEQRDQRLSDRGWPPIRQKPYDPSQHLAGLKGELRSQLATGWRLPNDGNQLAGELYSERCSLFLIDCRNSPFNDAGQMQGNPIRSL
jgi:hypothetical protein